MQCSCRSSGRVGCWYRSIPCCPGRKSSGHKPFAASELRARSDTKKYARSRRKHPMAKCQCTRSIPEYIHGQSEAGNHWSAWLQHRCTHQTMPSRNRPGFARQPAWEIPCSSRLAVHLSSCTVCCPCRYALPGHSWRFAQASCSRWYRWYWR